MVTPCINNIQHFNYKLTHTTLRNVELLKHSKISKTAPTCFGLQGNHHQGATVSTWLQITHLVKSKYVEIVTLRFLTLCASVGNESVECRSCFNVNFNILLK